MATYAVGDIHGCFDEWLELKNRIESEDADAQFILVGDIVDRGPKVPEMVEWAMQNITDSGKYQMVMGNHEEEKIEWLDWNKGTYEITKALGLPYDETDYIEYTEDRYDMFGAYTSNGYTKKDAIEAINWFNTLPYYKDITVRNQRFIIVHANLPYEAVDETDYSIKKELNYRVKQFIIWDRDVDGFNKIPNAILIHGHTPTCMAEAFPYNGYNEKKAGRIIKTKNRYNIDCGIAYSKYYKVTNLAALRLEDLHEIYLR